MSYATILANLAPGRDNAGLLAITGELATQHGASVIGFVACQPMTLVYSDGYISGELIQTDREETEAEIKRIEVAFFAALSPRVNALTFRSTISAEPLAARVAEEASCADLIVSYAALGNDHFAAARQVSLGDLVMQAGRPVLVVPPHATKLSLETVLVGWKNTRETRRAVSDALPLLKRAGAITIVALSPEDASEAAREELAKLTEWLARHEIKAETLALVSTGDDAERLRALVTEGAIDLVVGGAYGHSRLREWVFGGVTRDVLLAGPACALVSH